MKLLNVLLIAAVLSHFGDLHVVDKLAGFVAGEVRILAERLVQGNDFALD